jgi:actin-like ATPase involved in cell morphogenesis
MRSVRDETKIAIVLSKDPLSDVVLGAGKTLDNISILREVASE